MGPVEIGDEKGEKKVQAVAKTMPEGGKWSGEASRNFGFGADDASVTIDFGENKKEKDVPKDVPVWITQSTVGGVEGLQSMGGESSGFNADIMDDHSKDAAKDDDDDITKLLLQHEKKNSDSAKAANLLAPGNDTDSDSSDDMEDIGGNSNTARQDKVEAMSSDDDDDG